MRLLTVVLLILYSAAGFGQEELDDNRKVLKRKDVNVAMSEPVYKRLSVIHEQMGEENYAEALDLLRKLSKQRLSDYESALVQQTYGFVYAQQGQEKEAIARFEESLAIGALPAAAHQGMLYSLAGLYAADKQYMKSIETTREWFRYEESPNADAYMMIGSAFAQLERLSDALPYVLKSIEKSTEPRQSWYMLALSIHLQLEDFQSGARTLHTMLKFWPDKPTYWDMLAGCYLELEEDKRALDTMMLAYSNGMMTTASRVLALAQLSINLDVPFTGGQVLAEQIRTGLIDEDEKSLKLLLQAWLSAKEYDRAVDAIHKLGAFADDGRYYLQAAQIYYELGEWEKVAENAALALEKGLDKPMDGLLLQGTAYTELNNFDEAVRIFQRVQADGERTHRRNAESWLAYINDKRELRAARLAN